MDQDMHAHICTKQPVLGAMLAICSRLGLWGAAGWVCGVHWDSRWFGMTGKSSLLCLTSEIDSAETASW